ncbi:MAG: SBBP repeat-containing protein [Candidatus Brocadia sp.]|nr:SBBP repeat-containing protein [Candidatus Brocadia sp.]
MKPNAKPDEIKVKITGAKALKVNKEGQLEAETDLGKVKFTKPLAYQEIDGKRVTVEVEYRILNQKSEHVYSFKVASYNRTKDLIIDPLLASTFLGGSRSDLPEGSIATDSEGNIYVAGSTSSPDFPTTTGVYDTSYNGGDYDVFVSKLSGDLTSLLASTYLGGSDFDEGDSIALDSDGNVYITGRTMSLNFPITTGVYDTSHNGVSLNDFDAFVSKLNPNLTSLLASTYLGGLDHDGGYFLAIDSGGYVYVTGSTESSDFPSTNGAYDKSYNGGSSDGFISRLNGNLTSLLASTYLGGSSGDYISSITMNSTGDIFVSGMTESSNFPTTYNAYDTSFNSDYTGSSYADAFVSRLNAGLTNLLSSTYLGGTDGDFGYRIGLDLAENVYVSGWTYSSNFPTTPGAYDTSYNGGTFDAYIAKLNGNLTNLLASTYLGGSHDDQLLSMAIDQGGNIFVTGRTTSKDFPTTTGAYDASHNGDDYFGGNDVFVSKMNGLLTDLLSSTYLGGSDYDQSYSLVVDSNGNIYVSGYTRSLDFPTTTGAYDTSYNYVDTFVSKLDNNLSKLPPEVITESTTSITSDSATLNGIVNANGLSTTAWFQYGPTSGSYTYTSSTQSVSGFDDTAVNIGISGLSAGTTYYYRIVAQNSAGTSNGNEMSFITASEKGGILGYVLDDKGNPINRARLRLQGIKTLISQNAVSNSSGYFRFSDLDADAYVIIAGKRGYKINKQTATLEEGEQEEIEIQLEKRR